MLSETHAWCFLFHQTFIYIFHLMAIMQVYQWFIPYQLNFRTNPSAIRLSPILNNSLGQSIKGRILGRAKIVSIVGPDIRLIAPDKKPAGTTWSSPFWRDLLICRPRFYTPFGSSENKHCIKSDSKSTLSHITDFVDFFAELSII